MEQKPFYHKYIGDREFYRVVLAIALPILLQNVISSFVSLLDNLMVGQLGTECMSGVAVVNQLVNVYYISIFGAVSGASIFGSQFFGNKDFKGQQNAFRFKLVVGMLFSVAAITILLLFGSRLVSAFLTDDGTSNLALTAEAAGAYLLIILIGLIPNMLTQAYASSLRECGQTVVPMVAGITAVVVNLFFNYLLIFGNFGCPELGVRGAAIATVIARFVEAGIIMIWSHAHEKDFAFLDGVFTDFRIPSGLVRQMILKGSPLFCNEFIWSIGQALLVQCYSTRGLNAVAALNISTTISSLFFSIFFAFGNAIGILVGQKLGAGETEEAVDVDRKLIAFSVAVCTVIAVVMFFVSPLFPRLYQVSEVARTMATELLRIVAVFLPVQCYYNACYFTLRSGGKTLITLFFDGGYLLLVNCTAAFLLSRLTGLSILYIFTLVQLADCIKIILGTVLLKKRVWVNNLVA